MSTQRRIVVVIPTYDDWESLELLLQGLDDAVAEHSLAVSVLAVNDGSHRSLPESLRGRTYRSLRRVELLHLRRNLGHQRAIALGLVHLHEGAEPWDAIVVMDGDGQDRPADVPRLVAALLERPGVDAVFAQRTRRPEPLLFQAMYHLYRALHWLLTGIVVRVGNFSALRPHVLDRLVVASELWNHYAASVFRSRIPLATLPLERGERTRGESKMNFPNLVLHGLSAISVFGDVAGARLMLVMGVVAVSAAIAMLGVLGVRLFTDLAIPGWATSVLGLLGIALGQAVLMMLVLSFVILSSRSNASVIPRTDTRSFRGSVEPLYTAP